MALSKRREEAVWAFLTLALAVFLSRAPLTVAAVAIAAPILVAAILWKPAVAVALIGFAVPFGSLKEFHAAGAQITVTEGLVFLLLFVWLFRMADRRKFPSFPAVWLYPLLCFIGAITLSLAVALSLKAALPEMVKWAEVLLVYLSVRAFVSHEQALWVAASAILAADLEALLGAWQFFTMHGPEGFVLYGRFMRAYGTFQQPNPFAGYLGLILPVALSLALWALLEWDGNAIRKRWWAIGFYGGSALLILTAIGMSWSRGAWLGLLFGIATVIVIRPRRSFYAISAALAVGVVAILAVAPGVVRLPGVLASRMSDVYSFLSGGMDLSRIQVTDANFSSVERLAHWLAGMRMWADHPWLGVGIGNYPVFYSLYNVPRWQEALGHAHNYYINTAAEAGIVGLLGYLTMWIGGLKALWRGRKASSGATAALAIGAMGSLMHLGVHNGFDNLFVHGVYLIPAVLIGLGENSAPNGGHETKA